jgi:RNA polymerase sigma-70 factor, ECF subfamily
MVVVIAQQPFGAGLVEGVRARDPDTPAAVWRVLCPPLVRWLRSQVGDLAEDVAQSTFLELVQHADRLPADPSAIRAWLYTAARHNVIDHRRRTARRPEIVTASPPDAPVDDEPGARALVDDTKRTIRAALAALTPQQRQVVTLRFLGELSAPEVAEVLEMTEGAVRAAQHRGVAAMARLLAASLPERCDRPSMEAS